jgi:hypothetical protein
MPNLQYKEFEALKPKLIKSLREALGKEASPPGERPIDYDIHIPEHTLSLHEDEENTAEAAVIYTVRCPSVKTHTVLVKFKYSDSGKILNDEVTYV